MGLFLTSIIVLVLCLFKINLNKKVFCFTAFGEL